MKMMKGEYREITPLDRDFPDKLRDIGSCPRVLYVRGCLPDPERPSDAIIGARDGTDYGRDVARSFGRMLSQSGVDIISGMAYGIDAAGQWGAVDAGGKTFAVLGCGLNVYYPPSNYGLYEKLLECGGGAISEHPLDTPPLGRHFASRNRIISALADAVLVMEAKEMSGTSITVSEALKQGKQVFALPGRITDRLSAGCNRLIRDGAEALTSVEDVLEFLHLEHHHEQLLIEKSTELLSRSQKKIYSLLREDSMHIDQVLKMSGMTLQEVLGTLMELEILGFSESPKSGYYRRKICKR